MSEAFKSHIPADADTQTDGYFETCKEFLLKLSNNQIESLRNKYFFHVTNERHMASILRNGLTKESTLSEDGEDFLFLESLYKKYGRSGDSITFYRLIMGRDESSSNRPIYLSTKPQTRFYEIPERIKFLVRNLHLLANAPYTTQVERQLANDILKKYHAEFTGEKNKIVVLKISAISPPILNSLIGGNTEELNPKRVLELYEYIQDFESFDYQTSYPIPTQFINEEDHIPLGESVYDGAISKGAGICFDEQSPGTPIDFEMLTENARIIYQEFTKENGRPPSQEEIGKLLK